MQRIRVVRRVHGYGVWVVINSDIYASAGGQFYSGARPAASGKVINDNLSHAYSSMAAANDWAATIIDGTGMLSSHIRVM